MMILLYGFGWIYLISAVLSYNLSFFEVFGITIVSYVTTIVIFGTKRRVLMTGLIIGGSVTMGFIILVITEKLTAFMLMLQAFFAPYIQSTKSGGEPIDLLRQALLIFVLSLLIYGLMQKFKEEKLTPYAYLIFSVVLLTAGFVENRLSSNRDRYAILFFLACSIIYYFYQLYRVYRQKDQQKKFISFAVLAVISGVFILGLSQMMFNAVSFPFLQKQRVQVRAAIERTESLKRRYEYEIKEGGFIEDSFTFEGLELFLAKTYYTAYLKAIVYEDYLDNAWQQNEEEQLPVINQKSKFIEQAEEETVSIKYTHLSSPILLAAPYAQAMLPDNSEIEILYDENRGTYRIDNFTQEIVDKGISYSFTAQHFNPASQDISSLLNQTKAAVYNDMDSISPRIRELALEITADSPTDYEKVRAIINYLENNYTYNLMPKVPENNRRDKVEFFLFDSKEGFCQHYSSAAALLLRSIGIYTRYVTGFRVDLSILDMEDYYDPVLIDILASGYIPVMDNDAHTWIEVYFNEYGWIMFESTGLSAETVSQQLQNETDIEPVVEEVYELSPLTKRAILITGIVLAVLAAIGLAASLILMIRRSKQIYRKSDSSYRFIVHYKILMDYLRAGSLKKYDYETPLEYAVRIDEEVKEEADSLMSQAAAYTGIIYGNRPIDEEQVYRLKCYMRAIKKSLKRYTRLHDRLIIRIKEYIRT